METTEKPTQNLSSIEGPSFLLNLPTSFDTKVKNNIWMQQSKDEDLIVDKEYALAQWTDLYNVLAANSLVTILPTPKDCKLQDLVFVANLGIVLNKDTVVISNFSSEPRVGETEVGKKYFELAGYENVIVCPFKFEGEADLKHLRDNIFIGGYGMRTDIKAFEWMEKEFGIKIIKLKMSSEELYHFDCSCFPVSDKIIMLCKEIYTQDEIEEVENYCEIIDIPLKMAHCGITNNVRVHNFILNSSDIYDIDPIIEKDDYMLEREKNQLLEDICNDLGMEPIFINLSEFMKGGALLSCCVMHLNRFSYNIDLV